VREFTPQLIDKRSGQNPGLIGVDDANDDVHGEILRCKDVRM
jgi:hypothetical protein